MPQTQVTSLPQFGVADFLAAPVNADPNDTDQMLSFNPATGAVTRSPLSALPGGGGSAGPAYTHTQGSANSSWTVAHNLGRNPLINLIVGGAQVQARVSYPTTNSALIEFNSAVAGVAHCY